MTTKRWDPGKRLKGSAIPGVYMGSPSFTNTVLAPKWGALHPPPKSEQRQCQGLTLPLSHSPVLTPPTVLRPLLSGSSLVSTLSAPSLLPSPTWHPLFIHPGVLSLLSKVQAGPHPHPPLPPVKVPLGRLATQTPGSHHLPLPQGLPSSSPAASGLGRGYF